MGCSRSSKWYAAVSTVVAQLTEQLDAMSSPRNHPGDIERFLQELLMLLSSRRLWSHCLPPHFLNGAVHWIWVTSACVLRGQEDFEARPVANGMWIQGLEKNLVGVREMPLPLLLN